MNPIDELVLQLARTRDEPVSPPSIAILFTKGREVPREEFLALCAVAEGALARLCSSGFVQRDEDGNFWPAP